VWLKRGRGVRTRGTPPTPSTCTSHRRN
jgi:hypothetical protein